MSGFSRDRLYTIWNAMIQRCTNSKNKQFPKYGGRGISVHENWLPPSLQGYPAFREYVLSLGKEQGLDVDLLEGKWLGTERLTLKAHPISSHPKCSTPKAGGLSSRYTLDRRDNNKGYEPGNLRWVDEQVQKYNRRSKRVHLRAQGVSWREAKGRWQAFYSESVDGKGRYRSLGYYGHIFDAVAARRSWEVKQPWYKI